MCVGQETYNIHAPQGASTFRRSQRHQLFPFHSQNVTFPCTPPSLHAASGYPDLTVHTRHAHSRLPTTVVATDTFLTTRAALGPAHPLLRKTTNSYRIMRASCSHKPRQRECFTRVHAEACHGQKKSDKQLEPYEFLHTTSINNSLRNYVRMFHANRTTKLQ